MRPPQRPSYSPFEVALATVIVLLTVAWWGFLGWLLFTFLAWLITK